jgi:hypothetical protein
VNLFLRERTRAGSRSRILSRPREQGELVIENGVVVGIRILPVAGMRPLTGNALANFELLVSRRAEDIVRKWIEFFVHRRPVNVEIITRRLK